LDVLLSSLPDDIYVYIKEHPNQEYACRYHGFYFDLCAKSNKIILIKNNISSRELIKNSCCVATVSGTAGWEALFSDKPVLLFGYNFYMYAPYVYSIKSDKDCKQALHEVLDKAFHFDEDKFKIFLNAVADTCIHGFIDSLYKDNSNYSFEESNINILKYLRDINV
jgi:capsule polysaccharide export protein KpsC/LpsZ